MTESEYLKVRQVADKLNVCPAVIYTLMRLGKLKAIKVMGAYRVLKESLEAFIEFATVTAGEMIANAQEEQPKKRGRGRPKKKPHHEGRGSTVGFTHLPATAENPPNAISER